MVNSTSTSKTITMADEAVKTETTEINDESHVSRTSDEGSATTLTEQPAEPENMEVDEGFEIAVQNLQLATPKSTVRTHFSRFGNILRCVLLQHDPEKDSKDTCSALISFQTEQARLRALSTKHAVDCRLLTVADLKDKPDLKWPPKRPRDESEDEDLMDEPDAKKVYYAGKPSHEITVRKIKYNMTERTLKDHFVQFGTVESVRLPRTSSGNNNKGYAFIRFSDAESVEAALATEHEIDGYTLVAKRFEQRAPTPPPGPNTARNRKKNERKKRKRRKDAEAAASTAQTGAKDSKTDQNGDGDYGDLETEIDFYEYDEEEDADLDDEDEILLESDDELLL